MQKKFDDFSMQEAMRLANSDVGKQLIALFQEQHGAQYQTVMNSAKTGDLEEAKRSLADFMSDPKTQALLRQLQEGQNGRNGR